ncbi:fimbrial protein [Enterobacter sp. 638]|uniref:Fimbrial protein n=1 Tax=Enterobacter sp. (strain 638) TaxID=399742 RepID=A0A9J9GDH4_ENT38|nr:fimbrial protein [Enterobacter sp. 638]ABP58773.1 Fimbrial protein [Enterobacter sp. 638]
MKKLISLVFVAVLQGVTFNALAGACALQAPIEASNLTIPLVIQLPAQSATAATGTVLYKKEASLAQLTGSHHLISNECVNKVRKTLAGRMTTTQSGSGVFNTPSVGLGLRITLIFDKPNHPHKEWVLPFNSPVSDLAADAITTDDIKIRLEAIKTGIIKSGIANVQLPSLLSLNDNSLVVNLALKILPVKSHCSIEMVNPQVDLPPIDAATIDKQKKSVAYPANINLLCLNTQRASINIEGNNNSDLPSVFNNIAKDNPATGVGVEMLYNGSTLTPGTPVEIALPNQSNFALPISVRYARLNEKISQGNVKTQITLRINYL